MVPDKTVLNPFVWMGVRSDSSAAGELHAKNVRTLLLPVP